ncbi:ATPase [Bacteroidia bacterium]|nr:ATPase [Bacteroidia bacterium]
MIERPVYLKKIRKAFKHLPIVVLIGARQVGKTTIMQSFSSGKQSLYLIGQDIDVAELFSSSTLLEQYLQTKLNAELDALLMIDEFQYINNISTKLKVLTDKYPKLQVLCSGSSSLDILQNVEESLAGRVRIIEVLSLSFEEYISFVKPNLLTEFQNLSTNTQSSLLTAPFDILLSEYLLYGGLPRVALATNYEEKTELLNDIYQTYLWKDVKSYIKNEHSVAFNRLLRLLSNQIGNLVNVNNLSKESGLAYNTCEQYIYILEQMYIIKLLEPFSNNRRKEVQKMKKVYFYDTGLRNVIERNFEDLDFRRDKGSVFENHCFLELWRNKGNTDNIKFYRISESSEVDFFVDRMKNKIAIECKYSKYDKPFSINILNKFAEEEGISQKFIINKNFNALYNGTQFIQGIFVGKII